MTAQGFVPWSVRFLDSVCHHSIRACVRVGYVDLNTSLVPPECEPHGLGWGACHLYSVVTNGLDLHWETREAFLACIKSVPTMVHIAVDRVAVLADCVHDFDGLDSSILSIRVQRLEQKNTKVDIGAVSCIPVVSNHAR